MHTFLKQIMAYLIMGMGTTLFLDAACVPSGTAGDDQVICTGTVNGWQRLYGGSDRVQLQQTGGQAVYWLDESIAGNPATDGDDTFEANGSHFFWVFGFGGDDDFAVRESVFNNLYGDTNPYRVSQRGSDTILVERSTSNGWILGGNDDDTLTIRESNVSFVASGYSNIYPDTRPGHTGLFDYTPHDGDDTILLDRVNFTEVNYAYPTRVGAVESGKGDDAITFIGGGEAYSVTAGHDSDTILVQDGEHFNPCTFVNDLNHTVSCGIYGDEPYGSEPNATAIPLQHGDDRITLEEADVRGIVVQGGDGSDTVQVETLVRLFGTIFDGGDDHSQADGFVDRLVLDQWSGDLNGSLLRNWEQIVLDRVSDIEWQDDNVSVGFEAGTDAASGLPYGLIVRNNSRMQVNHDFLVDGNLHNRAIIDLRNGGIPGTTLRVQHDYGAVDGQIHLDTVLNGASPGISDRLHVQGSTSGVTQLQIENAGGTGAPTPSGDNQGILVVQVDGVSAGNFMLAAPVTAGDYRYNLHKAANGNWYLQSEMATAIGGRVCFDANHDGVCDIGEASVAEGVTVELLDASEKVIQTTKIDASGRYKFYLEGDNRYRLHFILSESLLAEGYAFSEIGLAESGGYTDWIIPDKGTERLVWDVGIACPCGEMDTDTGDSTAPVAMYFLFGLIVWIGGGALRRCRV
jgi:hypothetical protein